MTSTDERDRRVRALYAAGSSAIEISAEVGLSRSQVHRIVAATPVEPEYDGDEDPWDDPDWDDDEELNPAVPVPLVEPVTYCGKGVVHPAAGSGR